MGVLDTGSSSVQGITNAQTGSSVASVLGRQGSSSRLPVPPRYSFEIWDQVGPASDDALRGVKQIVVFRLAPNNISFSQPVRSDVALDLLGNPVVVDGGLGLGQCTIRGSYGVGGTMDPAYSSPGFANMREVREFFVNWAALNKARALDGLVPLRLVFSIRNGTWSEWRLLQWWAVPTSLPTEERTAGRPHEWSYSCSFWCLDMIHAYAKDTLPAAPTPSTVSRNLLRLQTALAGRRKITDRAKDLANDLATLQSAVSRLRSRAIAEVRGVTDTVRRAALAVNGILVSLNPSTFREDVNEAYRGTLIDVRLMLGRIKLWNTTMAKEVPGFARVSPVVAPGGTIQQLAAQAGGMGTWPDLAAKNGLRYPFVDTTVAANWTSPLPDNQSVLKVGDSLAVRQPVPGVGPADLVGSDMDPAGSYGSPVGGVRNLQNALLRRIGCPLGYLPHHPDYGSLLHTYLGMPLDLATVISLRDEVGRVLLADPRVTGILALSVDVDSDVVSVSASLDTVLGAVDLSGQVGRVEAWYA